MSKRTATKPRVRSKAAKRATPPKKRTKRTQWSTLSRREYLEQSCRQEERWAEDAADGGSWQGAAMHKRIAVKLRAELEALRAVELEEANRRARTDRIESLAAKAGELPDPVLEVFVRAYLDRHKAKLVHVGGRATA